MPYVFFITLTILMSVIVYKTAQPCDRKYLVWLFLVSVALRSYLSTLLTGMEYMNGHCGFVSGDDRLYSLTAVDILKAVKDGTYRYQVLSFGSNMYTHILAVFYGVFGYDLMASKLINAYIGSFIPILAYVIALRMTGENMVARIAAFICAFYPSYVYWSTYNLKDPLIILSVCLGAYIFYRIISREFTIGDIALFLLYAVMVVNTQLIYLYQLVLVGIAAVFSYCTRPVKILFSILALFALSFLFLRMNILARFVIFAGEHQWHMATTDISGYYFYTQKFIADAIAGRPDIPGLALIYLKGLGYFLFSPFPWKAESARQLLSLPQIFLWYGLFLFFVYGFMKSVKVKPVQTIAMFAFVFVGMSIWAFIEGNVGAAFRHRDHLSIVIFIYASSGIAAFSSNMRSGQGILRA